MGDRVVGAVLGGPNPRDAVASIVQADELGLGAAWLSSGSAGGDSLSVLAAAAAQTERIRLGTSIIPIFPRHPITLAQQAQVVDSLAPGRVRLGLGPSAAAGVEGTFGIHYSAPIGHLREYITILKSLLQEASVDFDGKYYKARSSIGSPVDVKVIGSALGTGAFEMCGAVADGAISWVCPHEYLREAALPAMQAGARSAGRGTPELIAHAPVCVHDDIEEARDAVRRQLGGFASSPNYAKMFAAAGFPNSAETGWTDEMLDAVLLTGDEDQFRKQVDSVFEGGATEVYGSIVTAGADSQASYDRTLEALASYPSG